MDLQHLVAAARWQYAPGPVLLVAGPDGALRLVGRAALGPGTSLSAIVSDVDAPVDRVVVSLRPGGNPTRHERIAALRLLALAGATASRVVAVLLVGTSAHWVLRGRDGPAPPRPARVLDVPCPVCGALPGDDCRRVYRGRDGSVTMWGPILNPHRPRSDAFRTSSARS